MRDFNEEQYQAFLAQKNNPGLSVINDMNPAKAREIYNYYAQLNK